MSKNLTDIKKCCQKNLTDIKKCCQKNLTDIEKNVVLRILKNVIKK